MSAYLTKGRKMSRVESLPAAGVLFCSSFLKRQDSPAPLIILWHGFGFHSEQALAETMP